MAKPKFVTIFSIVSGLGLVLSLPFFAMDGMVWIGFVPLLTALAAIKKTSPAFRAGYLSGFIYFAFTFRWLWEAYPLKALGLNNPGWAFLLLLLAWSLTVAGLALFWGLAFWLFKKIEPRPSWAALLIFPSIFTLLEYLRSFFLSTLWFAPGMAWGPHWTLGNVAYALHQSSIVLSFSSLVGIYGTTFLVAAINVLIFLFLEHRRKAPALLVIGLVLTMTYVPFRLLLPSPPALVTVPVAIVQTQIPSRPKPQEQLAAFRRQLELLDRIAQENPETKFIVFPEGGNFFTSLGLFSHNITVSQYFDRLFPSSVIILDNVRISQNGTFKSRTISLDTKKGIIDSYDKYLLTPGGEYVPSLFRKLDQIIALDSLALRQVEEFSSGETNPPVMTEGSFSWQPLVCSDLISPLLARSVRNTADILATQASFAFVDGSSDLIAQTRAMALFRAAENRRSLLFASNEGPSFLASPAGTIIKKTDQPGFEILTGNLVLNKGQSLYNRIGDGPIVMASLSVLILSFFWREKKK